MEDEKDKFLQALRNVSDKNKLERSNARTGLGSADLGSRNLAKGALDSETLLARGSSMSADVTDPVTKMKGTDVIDTRQVAKTTPIGDFTKASQERSLGKDLVNTMDDALKTGNKKKSMDLMKYAYEKGDKELMQKFHSMAKKIGKGATKGLKALPIVGGLASALVSGDASAAIPILGDSEGLGESPEAEAQMIAEAKAMENYNRSPARRDRLKKLAELSKLKK